MFEAVSSRLWSLKCSSPDCIPGTVAVPEDKAAVMGTEAGCTLVAADLAVSRRIPLMQTDLQSRVNNNCKSV